MCSAERGFEISMTDDVYVAQTADGPWRRWNGRAALSLGGATTAMTDAGLRRTESEYSARTGINRAGCRRDRISGDAACCADWVLLTEDNRLTTVESRIFRT